MKFIFVIEFICLTTFFNSDLFTLEVVQKCQQWQICISPKRNWCEQNEQKGIKKVHYLFKFRFQLYFNTSALALYKDIKIYLILKIKLF